MENSFMLITLIFLILGFFIVYAVVGLIIDFVKKRKRDPAKELNKKQHNKAEENISIEAEMRTKHDPPGYVIFLWNEPNVCFINNH